MDSGSKGVALFTGLLGTIFLAASGAVYDFNQLIPRQAALVPAEATSVAALADTNQSSAASETSETAPQPEIASLPESTEEPAKEETAPSELPAVAEITIPTFDILRVEPDGSTLIAGRASAGSEIEIVRGSEIVAEATANEAGEFVAILERELPAGDHTMVIRSTNADGRASTSAQTAIVAIPDDRAQGVLALVEEPGSPSRLISKPQANQPQLLPVEPAETEVASAEEAEAATGDGTALPGILSLGNGTPLLPSSGSSSGETATEIATAPTAEPVEVEQLQVGIEAVEIDGLQVFVAGNATPGTRLRVYANEILLGDTVAGETGRFLVQVARELPPGDYIIRADALDPQTADVLRRAAVPFSRTDGTRQAAVAVAPSVTLPDVAPDIEVAAAPTGQGGDSIAPEVVAPLEGSPEITADVGQLQPTDQSVIIRKGDSLWQISRRIYGKGVKYSTIYLANQDQIKDPGRIWPGQVFAVPDEAADEATAFEKHQELRSQN
ncbi:MAG: LysM peptidoglycan-binding domain-containing protein [Pseudomonadota bacterium]